MIRICHLITDLDAGGAERMLVNVVTRLDRSRFENSVISLLSPGVMGDELRRAGIPVRGLGMMRGRASLTGFLALVRFLRQTRPTILQSWLYHADLAATLASWCVPRTSLLWNLRCSDLPSQTERLSRLVQMLAWMSGTPKAIVVNSEKGAEFHRQFGYRPRDWVFIANGVDTMRFRPDPDARARLRHQFGIGPEAPVIGLVARYHPMKDFPTFVEAARGLVRLRPDVRFVVGGQGFSTANAQVVEAVGAAGLEAQVHLLGTRSDMENVYPAFDVLTLSSAYGEGFPNVLIEAMACGVPCVATDVGDSRAIVGETGIVVPPRDPQALIDGWHTMIARVTAADVRERSRMRAAEYYGIERICRQYETLYETVARKSAIGH